MKLSKKIARDFVFPFAYKTGLIDLIGSMSKHSILNVMYHGVVTQDGTPFSPTHLTASQFEMDLAYYKKHFNVVSMSEAFDMYRNNIIPKKKTITLSFDDGFKNNLDTALPILEKYGLKTTFFISGICTQDMETRSLWTEYINTLNYYHRNEVVEIDRYKFTNLYDSQNDVYLVNYIKGLNKETRDKTMNDLIARYDLNTKIRTIPDEWWKIMTLDELKKFSRSKMVDIGSHGYFHYNMESLSSNEIDVELKSSKDLLEAAIDKPVISIAYPDGSYNKQIKDKASSFGYRDQLAVDYRVADDADDKRILSRYGVSCTTTFESNMFSVNREFSKVGFN